MNKVDALRDMVHPIENLRADLAQMKLEVCVCIILAGVVAGLTVVVLNRLFPKAA